MDFLKDYVIQLLMANAPTIAIGVGAVAALGVVLGLLKKLIASLFSAAVNAGDSAVAQLAAKPKAPLLALLAAALVTPAVWAGYHFSPHKVVVVSPPPPPPPPPPEFPSAVVAELTARIAALEAQLRRNQEEQARQAEAARQASASLADAKPPRPVAKPGQPVTYRDLHAWAIKALAWERDRKVRYDPLFLDPTERQKRINFCWAKECERRRKEALAAQAKEAEKWRLAQAKPAPVPPVLTPGQLWDMQMDMQARCRAQALAHLQKVQQEYRKAPEPPTLIGGMDYARRWR